MDPGEKQLTPLGDYLKQNLDQRHWSIAQLATQARVSKNTVINLMYGKVVTPRQSTMECLASALDCPSDELWRAFRATDEIDGHGSFESWLLSRRPTALWIALGGAVLGGFALRQGLQAAHATQAVLIVLLGLFIPKHRSSGELRSQLVSIEIADESVGDFLRYWQLTWISWGVLYVVMAAAGFPRNHHDYLVLALNTVQNCVTVFLVLCWDILARRTITSDLKRDPLLPAWVWIVLITGVALVELGASFLGDTQKFLGWVSGFAQGTALVLLVSRLVSPHIGKLSLTAGCLLFYAVIQGAWPAFAGDPELTLGLTYLALVLKCLLFLFIAWLLQSDVLMYYLAEAREFGETAQGRRWAFISAYRNGDATALRKLLERQRGSNGTGEEP